jgi:hypothetical protein
LATANKIEPGITVNAVAPDVLDTEHDAGWLTIRDLKPQ